METRQAVVFKHYSGRDIKANLPFWPFAFRIRTPNIDYHKYFMFPLLIVPVLEFLCHSIVIFFSEKDPFDLERAF